MDETMKAKQYFEEWTSFVIQCFLYTFKIQDSISFIKITCQADLSKKVLEI